MNSLRYLLLLPADVQVHWGYGVCFRQPMVMMAFITPHPETRSSSISFVLILSDTPFPPPPFVLSLATPNDGSIA